MQNAILTKLQKEFINAHEDTNVHDLALRFSGEDMPFLLTQISGRQIAKHKIPTWYANENIVYPVHLSMEQTSSEATALYKTSIIPKDGDILIDLTGGLGVDFSFLSRRFKKGIYVEQNEELCRIANNNFSFLKLTDFEIVNKPCENILEFLPKADLIYLDPSRRDLDGRKVFRIEDCSPNITEIEEQLFQKSNKILIKYSPMLDISLALKTLSNASDVHIVSINNECKELLFLLSKNNKENCKIYTVNIDKNGNKEMFSFYRHEEENSQAVYTDSTENYLYEPNASLLKSGAFKLISNTFNLKKLHINSHLYTSNSLIVDFPGRIFSVKNIFPVNNKNRQAISSMIDKANIAVRNFSLSVAQIRKKTSIKEGGDIYIFATTMANNQKVWIICEKATRY